MGADSLHFSDCQGGKGGSTEGEGDGRGGAGAELEPGGISVEAGTRGADTGGLAARDLSDAIRSVYKKKGKKVPPKMKKKGTRASDASAGQMPMKSYLFWL